MTQDIILGINRIDSELKNLFESVSIVEKSNNTGFFFNVTASGTINNKELTLIAELKQTDLLGSIINWKYLSNPNDANSFLIERVSNLDSIQDDMYDIIKNKRFDSEYLDNIVEKLDAINESNQSAGQNNIIDSINNIFIYHDVASFSPIDKVMLFNENVDIFIKTPYKLKMELSEPLKESTKLSIEQQVMKIEYVDYISFKSDNTVEISVTE